LRTLVRVGARKANFSSNLAENNTLMFDFSR
jgi:hypothetical protein